MSDQLSDVRAVESVLAVLPRSVDVLRGGSLEAFDVIVNGQALEIEWIGDGRLGDVRRFLADRGHRPDVVVARRLSPGARAALSDAEIGWVDESGAAEIAIGTIVVSRTGAPDRRRPRPLRWTSSVLAVAEAALCGVKPTASAMSDATSLSMGSCVNALRVLTDLGLLEAAAARGPDSARRVVDHDRLLAAYATPAETLASELRVEVGVTWRDLADGVRSVARQWDAGNVAYAATGAVAAEALAPFLTSVAVAEVYLDSRTIAGLEAAASAIGLRPIEGGRLVLRPFPTVSTHRLASEQDGLRVAPWPRVYVDLSRAGVRGEDAAEHLKEVVGDR